MSRDAQTQIRVGGMTCSACVRRAEKALLRVEGVQAAEVSLATERASIRHAPGVDLAALQAALGKAGFEGHPVESPAPERLPITRDLAISAALTLPVFVLSMAWHPRPEPVNWLIGVLAGVVTFGPGWRYFRAAAANLRHRTLTMDTLVAMGTLSAFVYSSWALFRYTGNSHHQSDHLYFETGAVIVTLILLGRWLEARARWRASEAIRKLMDLTPATAERLNSADEPEAVPVADLRPGDRVLIRPGGRIPVDGFVLEGEGEVDESMLTGEPMPVHKLPGAPLTGATLNGTGRLVMQVEKVGAQTVLAQIVGMVERAQTTKAPIQRLVDQVSAIFVPIVIGVALVTLAIWLPRGADQAVMTAISVLVVACPCALGLATPSALIVGTGRGAELGILIRDAQALEQAGRISLVAFDKTGTLTEGRPQIVRVDTFSAWNEADAHQWAADLEAPSEHPLARALAEGRASRRKVEGWRALPGRGVEGRLDGRPARVGRREWIQPPHPEAEEAMTEVWLEVDGEAVARFLLADTPKPEAFEAVAALHQMGLRTAMLTGDRGAPAHAVARELGIDEVHAGLLPGEKLACIRALQAEGTRVAMVGDGLNDAPALAGADLGIALRRGSEVAVEAAGAVLLRADLGGVPATLSLSRGTLSVLRSNLAWAFVYNVIMIPIAAAGWMHPMVAAGMMALSSVSVVGNALRLRKWSPRWS